MEVLPNTYRADKKYTVLSLDGGGVRGLMTTEILAKLEEELSHGDPDFKITSVVDLVIGTSAGGLIASALACGFSARELKRKMKTIIQATFSEAVKREDNINFAKYDAKGLEEAIKSDAGLGEDIPATKLCNIKKLPTNKHNPHIRLITTTMHYDNVTRSFCPLLIDSEGDLASEYTVLDAMRATSAAPTYFEG